MKLHRRTFLKTALTASAATALTGRDLPHLSYLLCSPDRDTHAKNWAAFFAHPVWLKLKNDPQYADTVSKVTSRFLVPSAYSQI